MDPNQISLRQRREIIIQLKKIAAELEAMNKETLLQKIKRLLSCKR